MLIRVQSEEGDDFFDDIDSPDRDTWVTSKWIADAVGEFDLDPCTNPRSHIRSKRRFVLEEGRDGLKLARYVGRSSRTWINPPYSRGQVIQWVRAYKHTRFCFLVRLDMSTDWFDELVASTELILVPRGRRIDFEPPPGVKSSSNPYPHGFLYRHFEDASPEIRALCYALEPRGLRVMAERAGTPAVTYQSEWERAERQVQLWAEYAASLTDR